MRRFALFGLLLVTGCGSKGAPAPDFTLESLDTGKPDVTLASLKGKVVLLDFWATWCEPCRETLPKIEKIHREFKDKGLVVIGVSNEPKGTQGAFLNASPLSYTFLYDRASEAQNSFGAHSIPHLFILNKEGEIVFQRMGSDFELDELKNAVRSQL